MISTDLTLESVAESLTQLGIGEDVVDREVVRSIVRTMIDDLDRFASLLPQSPEPPS